MKDICHSIFNTIAVRLMLLIISAAAILSCNRSRELKQAERSVFNETVTAARRISIEKHSDFTKVTIINPWQGADKVNMVYNLVRRGSALPGGMDSSMVLFVPLDKIICMSTTHIAMISALGEDETIAGMSGTEFMFSKVLTDRAEAGLIKDVGYEANLNKELILRIMPDLVMIYGIGSESTGYVGKLQELGIKVLYNADYLETDPLAKAEWIKLFGALYCKEKLADSIYFSEVEAYNNLKQHIAGNIKVRPKVLLGLPFKDTWFVSPGNSFISKLIGDAGGNYLWKDTESPVSMPFGLENVYIKALEADYWLNIGSLKTKDEISSVDPRLMDLPCFKNGNLYNNNRRVTDRGGNDYWESGAVYPHLILKDIAAIIHPELFGVNELFYYRKLL
jgi:iron complex transport system substrate-binding protein